MNNETQGLKKRNNDGKRVTLPELEVNLVPEEVIIKTRTKKRALTLLGTMAACVFIVSMVYLVLVFYQIRGIKKMSRIDFEIQETENQISMFREVEKRATDIQARLGAVEALLNKHIHWSKFLSFLEKYTLDDVYYTNLATDMSGKITLQAKAKGYGELVRQYDIFKEVKSFVQDVQINSASVEVDEEGNTIGVNFEIQLTIYPNALFL